MRGQICDWSFTSPGDQPCFQYFCLQVGRLYDIKFNFDQSSLAYCYVKDQHILSLLCFAVRLFIFSHFRGLASSVVYCRASILFEHSPAFSPAVSQLPSSTFPLLHVQTKCQHHTNQMSIHHLQYLIIRRAGFLNQQGSKASHFHSSSYPQFILFSLLSKN